MNVFVLCTGRCGSTTFYRACTHSSNYTAAHESRTLISGHARLDYPQNHIEVDNRLSWMLGSLDRKFGQDAFYVHLTRNPEHVAESFVARWDRGIMRAWREEISPAPTAPDIAVAIHLIETVTANIKLFLRDKPMQMSVQLESVLQQFPEFCERIGANMNLNAAMDELTLRHNARTA